MSRSPHRRFPFQLESLETRALLAGGGAITSTGDFVSNYDPATVSAQIVIASAVGGELTIDTALLSDVVKSLKLSGFDRVTITGPDRFESLDISHIGTFSASQIDVSSELKAKNVNSISLHALAGVAWLYGSETRLEIVDSRSATIVSNLDRLTVSTQNDLMILLAKEQDVRIEYESSRPNLLLPADHVTFVDTAPTPPGPDSTPSEQPKEDRSYTLVIVSLTSATAAEYLSRALKQGDSEALRTAFAEYVKNVELTQASYKISFPIGSSMAANSVPDGSLQSTLSSTDERPAAEVATAIDVQLQELDMKFPVKISPEELWKLPLGMGEAHGSTTIFPISPIEVRPASSLLPKVEKNLSGDERSLVIEHVRSTLSTLISDANVAFHTVSAYIIGDVGNKLEPGELPGLLVDPRSPRARKDAVTWVEV